MLILARREGETIMIGDNVAVTVIRTSGRTVELGIAAPRHVPVHRKEVHEAISRSGRVRVAALSEHAA